MSEPKMTILFHSVAPWISSGYGKVTRYVTSLLTKYGYRMIVSAYYGCEPGGVINYNGVIVLASKDGPFGVNSAAKFARQFKTDIQILHCYDDQTEILTNKGWKLFRDLVGSEEVVQYNEKEKYLEYVKPEKYFVVPYEGKMYYVESRDLSLCVSPNHRLYVKKRDSAKKNNYGIELPSEVLGKRRKYLKISTWKDKSLMLKNKRELSKILNKKGWTCSNSITRNISTKNRNLADKYQEIAIKAGFSSDIHKDRDQFIVSIKKRKDTEIRPKYGLGRDGFKEYKGFIYSLKVPSGLILTRRSSKIVISGNTDWWAFSQFPDIMPFPCIYSPMDHQDYPEEILSFTRKYKKIISLCDWQKGELQKKGIDSTVIPHGVDISIYKPQDKQECRKRLKLGLEDKFVLGTVAANSDKEDRKNHAGMIKAMQYFLEENPDVKDVVWLYHSNPIDPRGMPLSNIVHKHKLDNIVRFLDPGIFDTGLSEEEMSILYNAMDVHLLCSKREGFGIPIIESMACSIPNIVHNFSSPVELVKGRGWLVKSMGTGINYMTTPLNAETGEPDNYDLADKLKRAYFNTDERTKFSKASREFAINYNWDDIITNKWIPFLGSLELGESPYQERRIL